MNNIVQLESLPCLIYNCKLSKEELSAFEDFKLNNNLHFKGDLVKKTKEFYNWFLTNARGRKEYLAVGKMVHDYFSSLIFMIRNGRGNFHALLA